jgi:hypothetical protein
MVVNASEDIVTIQDFLTPLQIRTCIRLWNTDRANFHKRVLAEIVEPNMAEINRRLGQENIAGYIAYAIEHVMNEAAR